MYFLRKIIGFLVIIMSSCTQDENNDNIVFHVDVSEIEAYSAKITVTHNATNRDTYYGFVVKGIVNDVQTEIADFLSINETSQLAEFLHCQRKSVFQIVGLSPQETYTYVVFGMDSEGKFYGEPSSVVFTTLDSHFQLKINPNWKITYMGHTVYNNSDYSKIEVDVSGNLEERYFMATYEQAFIESFEKIEDLIIYAANEFVENLKNTENEGPWFEDSLVRVNGTSFYKYLHEGNYISYAIGINIDGLPTGSYVKTDCYHVDKYPAVEGFKNLLGEWRITSGNNQSYDVKLEEHIVNKYLILKGWGDIENCPIIIEFNREDNSLRIRSQQIKDDFEITFSDGTYVRGQLSLRGAYYNSESVLKWTTQSLSLTKGIVGEDGSYTFSANYTVTLTDGTKAQKVGMSYYIERENKNNIGFARVMFPFIMSKNSN